MALGTNTSYVGILYILTYVHFYFRHILSPIY